MRVVSRDLPKLGAASESAIGSFLWGGRSRILSVLPLLRRAGRTLECQFRGGSMRPAVPARSRLRIDAGAYDDCPIGRVVAYVAADRVMVHRVVYQGRSRRARGHLVMCGDRLVLPDLPVDRRWIIGPVIGVQTHGEWVLPGPPQRRRIPRFTASFLAAFTGALLEVDVRLAERFVLALHALRVLVLPKRRRSADAPGGSILFGA